METITIKKDSLKLESQLEVRLKLLENIPNKYRKPNGELLIKELIRLEENNSKVKVFKRFKAQVLYRSVPSQHVLDQPQLQPILFELLECFLSSESYQTICARLDYTLYEGLNCFGSMRISSWLMIWSQQEYPVLCKLLLNRQLLARYSSMLVVPFEQFVRYVPCFVFYRISDIVNSPRPVLWTRWMAQGNNIRKANLLPYPLSKKAAHWFTLAPRHLTYQEAMLYGEVRSLGGDDRVFQLTRNYFGTGSTNHSFRRQVIRLLVAAERQLGRAQIERMLGYISHLYRERENFSLKGRTVLSLSRQANAYYEGLQQVRQQAQIGQVKKWKGLPFEPFYLERGDVTYQIIQLTTTEELEEEGRIQEHCVASYAYGCATGEYSIWSLRKQEKGEEEPVRLVTIEVYPDGSICQARRKLNGYPSKEEVSIIRQWALEAGLKVVEF